MEENVKKQRESGKDFYEWVQALVCSVLVVVMLFTFVIRMIGVDGHSMDPTLADGERLFVTVADVKFGDVERGDVVICHYPNRGWTNFVKRVVAVPGDTVYRENGVTHVVYSVKTAVGTEIYDEELDPSKGYILLGAGPDYEPYVLDEDEYFVVGDNRYNSHDSRDWNDTSPSNDVGPITKDMIVGHVRHVIWPLGSIREVK